MSPVTLTINSNHISVMWGMNLFNLIGVVSVLHSFNILGTKEGIRLQF